MMLREPRKPEGETREVKFALPAELHIWLQERKICNGELISDIVSRALYRYLATTSTRSPKRPADGT